MADTKVRLSGFLPAAEMDGLQPLLEALVLAPKDRRIIIGQIDTATRRDHGDGEYEPTVRVLQIEVPQGELRDEAVSLLRRAYAQRTGAMQAFEDDGTDNWGIGGQAGRPLDEDSSTADLEAAGEVHDDDHGSGVSEEQPFQSPEPPQPVQDQVAKRRASKTTQED